MDTQTIVQNVLTEITGEDLSTKMDTDLFATALLDSMDTVQLILELETQLGINVPVSEFDRNLWNTPNKIIAQVESL